MQRIAPLDYRKYCTNATKLWQTCVMHRFDRIVRKNLIRPVFLLRNRFGGVSPWGLLDRKGVQL